MTKNEEVEFNHLRLFGERDVFIKALKKPHSVNEKDLRELALDQWALFVKNLSEYGASERAIELSNKFLKKYRSTLSDSNKAISRKKHHKIVPRYIEELTRVGVLKSVNRDCMEPLHNFSRHFDNLKKDLMSRYLKSVGKKFSNDSDEARQAYKNHISIKEANPPDFSNVHLIAFSAYNKFNDGGGSRGNPILWRKAFEYVANNSSSVTEESIALIEIDEICDLLINYTNEVNDITKEPNRLAKGDQANADAIRAIKDNLSRIKSDHPAIKVIETVHDLSKIVASLPVPSVQGLCSNLVEMAQVAQSVNGHPNIWNSAHNKISDIRNYGPALAPNFVKDLLLWFWNQEERSIDELHHDVIGQTQKPDIHLKRMVCLLLQPKLLTSLESYQSFSDKSTEKVLKYSISPYKSWQDNYYHTIAFLCKNTCTFPLEVDRVCYGLMSGKFNDGITNPLILPPTLEDLKEIFQ